jgi:hypothetical protein
VACALACCAAGAPTGPAFTPAPPPEANRALVYVYRIDRVAGVGPIRLRLDGGTGFDVRNGEYVALVVRPGGRKLDLTLPLFGKVSRGWTSIPFTARPGQTLFLRVWAGIEEIDRGPQGRPDDFGAPGRGNQYAGVNVFASVWPAEKSESDIRDLQLAPTAPRGTL